MINHRAKFGGHRKIGGDVRGKIRGHVFLSFFVFFFEKNGPPAAGYKSQYPASPAGAPPAMLFTRFEVGPGAILAPEAQERRRICSGSYKGERIFQIFFDTVRKFRLFGGFRLCIDSGAPERHSEMVQNQTCVGLPSHVFF